MTRPGLYLCGCDPLEKSTFNISLDESGSITNQRFDSDGKMVCPEHGARLYGWASPLVQHPGGQSVLDWGSMGSKKPLRWGEPESPDKRNFIDTVAEGERRLARRAASSNGAPSEAVNVE